MSKRTSKTNVNVAFGCSICGRTYFQQHIDKHMHSYFHHEAIEIIKGSVQLHKCWACDTTVMGLEQYSEHIGTRKHGYNLCKLKNQRQKGKSLEVDYNIDLTEDEFKALHDLRQQDQSKSFDQFTRVQKVLEKCSVCLHRFPAQEWDRHMHSFVHHMTAEQLKGSELEHKCYACEMTKRGLADFKRHISTQYHRMKMSEFMKNRALGKNTVDYSVDFNELKDLCDQRDQELFMKKREKQMKVKKAKKQKTTKFIQTGSFTAVNQHCSAPFMVDEFMVDEANQLPPSYHFMPYCENQNDHPPFIQLNQNLPTERQESILDMDRLNEPPVKRPCLGRPSENIPQGMSAQDTRPNPDGKSADVSVNDVTPETEDAAEPTRAPEIVQSMMEAEILDLTEERGSCIAAMNEAVDLNPPLHTAFKQPVLKLNKVASQSELKAMTRECMSGQEPKTNCLPHPLPPSETLTSQASGNVLEIDENVRPHAAHVQKNKSNECETEQGDASQQHHSTSEAVSCKAKKTKKKTKKGNSHDLNPEKNKKISRKKKVNKLISLSLKEEKLTSSLENVGEDLFQAYSTLQNAYTEVQRLLAVKKEVTSEMASLRAKRIKILQDMKDPSDQQEVLNES